jgi:hypothetical protein
MEEAAEREVGAGSVGKDSPATAAAPPSPNPSPCSPCADAPPEEEAGEGSGGTMRPTTPGAADARASMLWTRIGGGGGRRGVGCEITEVGQQE